MPIWLEGIYEDLPSVLFSVFLGSVVAAIPVGILVYKLTKERQLLEYRQDSTKLITKNISKIRGLQITMNEKPVENLTSTTIIFLNSGSQSIEDSDFRSTAPLDLTIEDGTFFGAENGFEADSNTDKLMPKIVQEGDKKLKIAFDCIKPKEKFTITVLHSGTLKVNGDLRKGVMRKDSGANRRSFSFLDPILITAFIIFAPDREKAFFSEIWYYLLYFLFLLLFFAFRIVIYKQKTRFDSPKQTALAAFFEALFGID